MAAVLHHPATGGVLDLPALLGHAGPHRGGPGPSYPPTVVRGRAALPPVGYSIPEWGSSIVPAGRPTAIQLGVVPAGSVPVTARWTARGTDLVVSPASGAVTIGSSSTGPATKGSATCAPAATGTQTLTVTAPAPGSYVLEVDLQTTGGTVLPPVVVDIDATG